MTKLSPAQLAILRRIVNGERLVKNFGEYGLYCWEQNPRTGPRIDSVNKLKEARFIERVAHDRFDYAFPITPAGRAYLEVLDE